MVIPSDAASYEAASFGRSFGLPCRSPVRTRLPHFSCVETVVKIVFRLDPIEVTAATMPMEMPAAISPYSIAVAPDSLFRNATSFGMWCSSFFAPQPYYSRVKGSLDQS